MALVYMVGLKFFRLVRARSTSHFFAMWVCRFSSRYGRVMSTMDRVTSWVSNDCELFGVDTD
jgi:hypothetical protein